MSDTVLFIVFVLPVFLSVALCFIKDSKTYRGIILNTILALNALFYMSPLLYAYWATRPNGNMWSENGPGAILWSYFIVFPFCGFVLLLLLVLKLVFRKR
ncbi:MAG: hypothetical protein AAGJ12_13010 [Bacteroidota bacterium]